MNFSYKFPICVSLHHDLHHYRCQCRLWMPTLFIVNVQDSRYGMPILFITEVPSNLSVPLVSKHNIDVLFWNRHIDNYVYGVFGFANKYLCPNGVVVVFHDDDPHVLKEIKSYLEGNGYEIWSKWVVINILPQMNCELRRKMVSFYLLSFQSHVDSKHPLSISNVGNFIFANLIELGHSFRLPRGWF